jgi:hypothetical protein
MASLRAQCVPRRSTYCALRLDNFAPTEKEAGLGAVRHREALLVFACGVGSRGFARPPFAKLCLDFSSSMSKPFRAWPQRFQVRTDLELSAVQ